MLMEEGKVRLSDPVSRFIPEFKETKVAVLKSSTPPPIVPGQPPPAPEIYTIPATREITVRDLLTHTSGLGSGGASAGEAGKVMQARKPTDTLGDFIPRLGVTAAWRELMCCRASSKSLRGKRSISSCANASLTRWG
jgi:CubicO group peptidase (beta-lactamase class C family)